MQLTHALEADTGWTKHTVITMLTRLETKDAVRWEQIGRTRHYSPVIAHLWFHPVLYKFYHSFKCVSCHIIYSL